MSSIDKFVHAALDRINVSDEMRHLMTWKCAMADILFGGAKGGINCDPSSLAQYDCEVLTKRFVERLNAVFGPNHDIPAPDMGTSTREMAWILEAYAQAICEKLIVEATNNIPTTFEAAEILAQRAVPVVPDIVANVGGVIVSYLEWVQNRQRYRWKEQRVNEELESTFHNAWEQLCDRTKQEDVDYRMAAYLIATERVKEAIQLRGF